MGRLITNEPPLNSPPVPTDDTYDNPEWDLCQPQSFPLVSTSLTVAGFLRNSTSRKHQWLYLARVHYQTTYDFQPVNITSLGYLDPLEQIVHYVDAGMCIS